MTADAVLARSIDDGLILLSAGFQHQVVRWMPPIDVTPAEIDRALEIFWGAVQAVPARAGSAG